MGLIKCWKGSVIMDNKKRIQALKRKNQITNLCKEWMNFDVVITMENFLEIEETLLLQGKILRKLDEMDSNKTSIIYQGNEKDLISAFEEMLINNVNNDEKYVFFVKGVTKIGGLILSGKIIIEKYQFIIKESEIFNNGCNIFFCSLNGENGVCLWKGEYDIRIYVW